MKLYDNLRAVLFPSGYKSGQIYPQKPLIWNNPAYWFNSGVSGNYCSTPNTTANQITGNIQITANINPSVLNSDQNIVNKSSVAGTTMGYNFFLNSSGGLSFAFSPTGSVASRTTVTSTVSLASVGILPNTNFWVRVVRNSVSGDIQFFTSIDGDVFTQLGSTVSSITGNLFSSTEPLFLGTWADTLHFFTGKINRVTISNSIGGNPVVDFNPNHFNWNSNMLQNGQWFTSRTTGEVWTINSTGQGYIQPYLETIPFTRASAGTRQLPSGIIENLAANMPRLDSPLNGCPGILMEPQRTNNHLGSDSMINMLPFTSGGTTPTIIAATSPRNTNGAIKVIGANNNAGSWGVYRLMSAVIPSGSKVTASVYAKADTHGIIRLNHANITASGSTLSAYFDLVNGTTPTLGAKIKHIGNGWYKCIMPTITLSANTDGIYNIGHFVVPDTTTGTWSTNYLNKSVFLYGIQVEVGDFDTSLILTGDSTVTRQADAITASSYQMLGLGGRGTIVIDYTLLGLPSSPAGAFPFSLTDNLSANTNKLSLLQENTTGLRVFDVVNNINWYSATQEVGNRYKVLIKWDNSYGCCYVNGVKVFENFNLSPIYFNYIRNMTMPNASIRLHGFHTDNIAVSHSDCIKLTTL